jgi:ABC-type transporter Mla subunit MlaD
MKPELSTRQLTRGEKETENEAARLIEHVEDALSAVAIRSTDEADSLNAVADRIERAARDLSTTLRELADQRRQADNAAKR